MRGGLGRGVEEEEKEEKELIVVVVVCGGRSMRDCGRTMKDVHSLLATVAGSMMMVMVVMSSR